MGVWVLWNQADDLEWPKPSEGLFSASLASRPNAPTMYGHVLPRGNGKGLPFAVVAASAASPHTAFGEATGYRFDMRGKAHVGEKKHRWNTVPPAAYCWVPNAFPYFPAPEVGPRTLLDFVAGDASFVLEALLALAAYLDAKYDDKAVHDRTESRAKRRRTDFIGQILAALDRPGGRHRRIALPFARMAPAAKTTTPEPRGSEGEGSDSSSNRLGHTRLEQKRLGRHNASEGGEGALVSMCASSSSTRPQQFFVGLGIHRSARFPWL